MAALSRLGPALVSQSGYAKLADFGLAKLAGEGVVDLSRTLTEGATRPGMVIGTVPYMSPEQASARRHPSEYLPNSRSLKK